MKKPTRDPRPRAVIAGGGLAGLTCAKLLVDAGVDVTLFEGLPFLGGRASTYQDRDGDWVEQGLHLFLGVYSEFKALLLTSRGAVIRTGVKLASIDYPPPGPEGGAGRVTGFVVEGGERLSADVYVAAVPVWALAPLVPADLRADPFFASLASLPIAPAISVQIWFDRRIVDTPDFTLVARTRAAVYQDQSTNAYPYAGGSRISVIVSPADDLLGHTDEALVNLVIESLQRVQPRALDARVVKSVVLKHAQHLVRPLPGAMSQRPAQATPVPNLFLAGDWTQQDFFGSQEGAVRGGKACAEAVLRSLASAAAPARRRAGGM